MAILTRVRAPARALPPGASKTFTDCQGNDPVSKSPNIIRALSSSMLAVHCLSCEHDNQAGAKFCAACGSTLNLKLCKQCEAINDGAAQHCHNCGAQFPAQSAASAQSPVKQPGVTVAAGAPDLRAIESESSLVAGSLSPRQAVQSGRVGPSRKLLSALLLAVIAGSAYHLYRQSGSGPNAIAAGAADASVVESATSALPVRPAQPSVTHTNRVATGSIEPRPDIQPTAAAAAGVSGAASTALASPALPVSPSGQPVTHTSQSVAAPAEPAAAVTQAAAAAAGATNVSTPAAATSALPLEPSYQPVTHTKRVDAAPAVASAPRVKLHPDQPSNCTPAVAALGFCTPSAIAESKNEKAEGN
jgi:double zinc ribbon protein